jgi:hypothetical protein
VLEVRPQMSIIELITVAFLYESLSFKSRFDDNCCITGDGEYMGAEYWVQLRTASCPFDNSLLSTETSLAILGHDNSTKADFEGKENEQTSANILGDIHGLEFHFDKDEQAAEEDNWIHPKYSTATYLDAQIEGYPAGGAPLIVFQTNSEEEDEEEEEEGGGSSVERRGGGSRESPENMVIVGDSDSADNDDVDEEEEEEEVPLLVDITEINGKNNQSKTAVTGLQSNEKEKNAHFEDEHGVEDLESDPRTPTSAWAIYPEINRHVSFPGGFLHGVAGELLQPSLLLSPIEFNSDNVSSDKNDKNDKNSTSDDKSNENKNSNKNSSDKNINKNSIKSLHKNHHTTNTGSVNKKQKKGNDEKCYNYSRLSLLVNIWTEHRPKMVQKLESNLFNIELNKAILEFQCENQLTQEKNKRPCETSMFNFQSFVENLEKNEKISCLTFSPKTQVSNNNLESIGSRSSRRKFSNRIHMEEKIDDGVIFAAGNGINGNDVAECHIKISDKSDEKEKEKINEKELRLHYLREHRACDTGPVPIEILKKEFRVFNEKKIRSKIIRIKYIYE